MHLAHRFLAGAESASLNLTQVSPVFAIVTYAQLKFGALAPSSIKSSDLAKKCLKTLDVTEIVSDLFFTNLAQPKKPSGLTDATIGTQSPWTSSPSS